MPGTDWFPDTRLSYAEHVFREVPDDRVAIIEAGELRATREITWGELREQTARIAAGLRSLGVGEGDRVVAYMPNIPEAMAAFLATASLGAIWSSCSPDFGARTVVDRFAQIEPKVLLAVDGYRYGGRDFDKSAVVAELEAAMPTLEHTVVLPYLARRGRRLRAALGAQLGRDARTRRRRCPDLPPRARSRTRCGCSTRPARPACRRRSCTGTAASCSST